MSLEKQKGQIDSLSAMCMELYSQPFLKCVHIMHAAMYPTTSTE